MAFYLSFFFIKITFIYKLVVILKNFRRVIWLGDLNYRVSLSYEETTLLLEDNDWDSLLEKDQVWKPYVLINYITCLLTEKSKN